MGVPYETKPQIVAVSGPTVFEIPWPNRSVVSKLIVVQLEGTGEAFTAALYNHPQVQTGLAASDSLGAEVGKIPDDCFRITPDLAATSGRLLYFSDQATGGYGYVFFSQEALAGRQGQGSPNIYLKITPVAGGSRRFAFVVGGMKEIE